MKFSFLSPAAIRPEGWFLRQLQAQAGGLNGNLDKVWKDVYDSKWLGGSSEGWERLPYFLDGYIPLAYLLGDEDKIARAKKYVGALLSCQAADGCFYPKGEEGKAGDLWAQFLILKVLTVYADCSGDESVEESVARGLAFLRDHTRSCTPSMWAAARWFECIVPMLWLARRRKEGWLVRFAERLKTYGFDYGQAMELWDEPRGEWTLETHVVNIAMALKSEAVYCELTGKKRSGLAERMLQKLTERHGTAYGHFTGDECLSGTDPVQGSELCGVVEAMYSYEWLAAVTGEAKWGDRLESLAFNALPAAVSADMWTHQYDQQVNQIACVRFEKQPFRTNDPDANIFGLEPNFGCCTANFGQGFPKLMLSAYLRKKDALVVLSPLPASVRFGEGNTVRVDSEYPFRAAFSLRAEKKTDILLRVPAWAKPACSVPHTVKEGWLSFAAPAGQEVKISFRAEPVLEKRPEGRYCLRCGALLFSVPVEGERRMHEYEKNGVERKFPYCDYEIFPVGEWRYAFSGKTFKVVEQSYSLPFDRERPPVLIEARLAPVAWECAEGMPLVAAAPGNRRRGEDRTVRMQPYGATYLRVTEMAQVKD